MPFYAGETRHGSGRLHLPPDGVGEREASPGAQLAAADSQGSRQAQVVEGTLGRDEVEALRRQGQASRVAHERTKCAHRARAPPPSLGTARRLGSGCPPRRPYPRSARRGRASVPRCHSRGRAPTGTAGVRRRAPAPSRCRRGCPVPAAGEPRRPRGRAPRSAAGPERDGRLGHERPLERDHALHDDRQDPGAVRRDVEALLGVAEHVVDQRYVQTSGPTEHAVELDEVDLPVAPLVREQHEGACVGGNPWRSARG